MSLPRIVLASQSPRRRELLTLIGIPHEVMPADLDETRRGGESPASYVERLAREKASTVARREPGALVIGADTTVVLDGDIFEKPLGPADAARMLRRLSGRTHTVFTGLAVRRQHEPLAIDEGVASDVTFKPLDDAVIEEYLSRVYTLDKAGGYAIQEHGDLIIAGYRGSYSNIVGLPLETTKQILTRVGLVP